MADPAYVTNLDPGIIERVEVISGPQASTAYVHVYNLTNDDNFERINTAAPRPRTWTFGVRF